MTARVQAPLARGKGEQLFPHLTRKLRASASPAEQADAWRPWAFHEAINGIKVQVEAQYGNDSPALHAVGLKRRSEHRRATRQKKSAA
ncbi:MAG: hypothetical protein HGA45_35165 [Chloroflexales bacterium]|nr:hypothetical protein [Chloroflexales bacterium]